MITLVNKRHPGSEKSTLDDRASLAILFALASKEPAKK